MKSRTSAASAWLAGTSCILAVMAGGRVLLADWPEWRGPTRDGVSTERNLPASWSPAGENLAWRAPYGGRSSPVVFGDRFTSRRLWAVVTRLRNACCPGRQHGEAPVGAPLQRLPRRDVPAAPRGLGLPDRSTPPPATSTRFGVTGMLLAFTADGKLLWERSLAEEFGLVTTHGGRTVSPVIEGPPRDRQRHDVGVGRTGPRRPPVLRLRQEHGQTVWVSSPQADARYDTTYSPPIVADDRRDRAS